MKVALISPTWSVPPGYEDRIRVPYPIGLIQIAAVLEQNGVEVKVFDALAEGWNIQQLKEELIIIGLPDHELIRRLSEYDPDYIGFGSLFTSQRDNLIRITEKIKECIRKPIIAGGVDPSIEYEACLGSCALDYIIVGEADYAFLELINALEKKKGIQKIPGIAYMKRNKVVYTGKRDVVKDLNALPMPAYHLLNFEKYFEAGAAGLSSRGITVTRWMSVFTSRGCPYHCNFCSIHLISSRKWRGKDAKKVIDEIEHLYRKYGINYIFFEDDNMTANVHRAEQIFDGIIARGLKICWETPNGVRADTITPQLAKKMKQSGCKKLIFGVENGDQEFLKNVIHKDLDLRKVVEATKIVHKEGIEVAGFFIIGIPGETRRIMIHSILFAMRLAMLGMASGFTLATPLPKTEMFEEARRNGYLVKYPLTPKDYLVSYSKPLMTTPYFTYKQLMRWKKIATLLTVFTLFLFHPGDLARTNTFQEILKRPGTIFKKVGAVLRGSS